MDKPWSRNLEIIHSHVGGVVFFCVALYGQTKFWLNTCQPGTNFWDWVPNRHQENNIDCNDIANLSK